jgi:hypothetical protein
MAHHITINHSRRVMTVTVAGSVTVENVMVYVEELMREPYLDLPYGVIVDYRDADLSHMHSDEFLDLRLFLKANLGSVHAFNLAILTHREQEPGLTRLFRILADADFPFETVVTEHEKEAATWAALHPNPARRSSEAKER